MNSEKLVTVITPLYNKKDFIEDWAKCLAEQTFLDKTNILLIDNASTDGSLELVEKYSEQYNLPIKIVRNKKNMGLLYSIKKAYRLLDTKYFAALDADDYWLSSQKLEKAVNFLEQHEDYSMYACNYYFEYSDSQRKPALPQNVPNMTFTQMEGVPFFQVSSTTFRNFFSSDLLDRLDYFTDKKNFKSLDADAFRNTVAYGSGKVFFENSLDSVYRCNIGIFGISTEFEKNLLIMSTNYELFEFYRAQFSLDNNAVYLLKMAAHFYLLNTHVIMELMKNFSFYQLKCTESFSKAVKDFAGETDNEKILSYLFHYGKILNDLGFASKN